MRLIYCTCCCGCRLPWWITCSAACTCLQPSSCSLPILSHSFPDYLSSNGLEVMLSTGSTMLDGGKTPVCPSLLCRFQLTMCDQHACACWRLAIMTSFLMYEVVKWRDKA